MGTSAKQVVGRDSITLDAIDKEGVQRKVRLNAQIIGPALVLKQDAPDDPSSDAPQSNAFEDEVEALIDQEGIVRPPYNLHTLAAMREQSTELGQSIQAMVTNVVGFGWQLRERPMPEEIRTRFEREIEQERFLLTSSLGAIHATKSLTKIRENAQWDKHSMGQGYIELIENRRGDLVSLNNVKAQTLLLTAKDKKSTPVMISVVRPDRDFAIEERQLHERFRKVVQIRKQGAGIKPVWFKQAGDPRQMDKRTGEVAKDGETIPFRYRATSLMIDAHYNPLSPYGVPIWIGNLFSILGSRSSEEINYNTLRNNAVPSMMVIVENGTLTPASIERMREWTEQHIQRSQNYSTFLLIEGETLEEGAPEVGNFKIRIEPMKSMQQQDELFQGYDANNRDKIRQSFRLPPIFVGRADDYSRASADTSRDIADEQIFAPERDHADWLINRFVLSRFGSRFHLFRSNHPNITDDIELIRMMGIGEKSGGVTPRIAARIMRDIFGDDLGPMPDGIDLDTPYSLQFARAQAGGAGGGIGGRPPGPAEKSITVDDLIRLRKSVEDELDDRFLEGTDYES